MDIKETYSFGSLTLNTSLHYLQHVHQIRLSPKCTQVFALLAENADNLVEKELVLETIWPDRFGADESLTHAISDIRKALREFKPGADKAIKTVPKRGYMLNSNVLEEAFSALEEPENRIDTNEVKSTSDEEKQPFIKKRWLTKRFAVLSVGCLLMLGLISYWAYYKFAPDHIDSIAVLPFETIGADAELETLAEGFGYEIAMQISFQNHIKIASPQAVDRLDSRLPLDDVADILDVSHIITGSVNTVQNEKNIAISLVHAGTQKILWTERHQFDEDSLLAIYESVLANFRYLGDNKALPVGYTKQQAIKPGAYANYLKAMQTIRTQLFFEWGEALPYLEKSLEIQPDFYPPMVSLAAFHSLSSNFGGTQNRLDEARRLLDRAKALNAADTEYYGAEALYQLACANAKTSNENCSIEQALYFIDKAIMLAPEYWAPLYVKGMIFQSKGDFEQALTLYKQSSELDPNVTGPYYSMGTIFSAQNDKAAFDRVQEKLAAVMANGTGVFLIVESAMELFHKRSYFDAYVLATMIEGKVTARHVKVLKIRIETELKRENSTRQISELPPQLKFGPFYKLFRLGNDAPYEAVDLIMQIDDEVTYRSWLARQHAEIMLKFASLEQLNSNYEKLLHAIKRTKSAREYTFMAYLMKLRNEDNWQQLLDSVFTFELNESYSDDHDYHLAHAEAYTMLNDFDSAFKHLELIEQGIGKSTSATFSPFMYWESPMLQPLSTDPRFNAMIARETECSAEINARIDEFLALSSREKRAVFEQLKAKYSL